MKNKLLSVVGSIALLSASTTGYAQQATVNPYLTDPNLEYQDSTGTTHTFSTIISTDMFNKKGGAAKLNANGALDQPVIGDVSGAQWGTAKTLEQYIADAISAASGGSSWTGDVSKAYFIIPGTAVKNNVASWFSDTLDVRTYGAKCDGTTDDASAINSAVIAAKSGNVIKLPAGTCTINSPIVLNKTNLTLQGAGKNATTLVNTSTSSSGPISMSADSLVVRDLTVATSVAVSTTTPAIIGASNNSAIVNVSTVPYTGSDQVPYYFSEGIDVSPSSTNADATFWISNVDLNLASNTASSGIKTSHYNTVVQQTNISNAGIGISSIGGNALFVSGTRIYKPVIGVSVSNTIASAIASSVFIDSPSQTGVVYTSSGNFKDSVFSGTVNGNGGSSGVSVTSQCPSCRVVINGKITNQTTGVSIGDATAKVSILPTATIQFNSVAVDASSPVVLNTTGVAYSASNNLGINVARSDLVFNVDDYSSTATTDGSAALIKTINAACAQGGGDVILGNKTYTLSATIPVTCRINLKGSGYVITKPKGSGTWLDVTTVLSSGKGYFDVTSGGYLTIDKIGVYEEHSTPSTTAGVTFSPKSFAPVVYVDAGGSVHVGDIGLLNTVSGIYVASGAYRADIDFIASQFVGSGVVIGNTTIPAHIGEIANNNYWEIASLPNGSPMTAVQIANVERYTQANTTVLTLFNGAGHHVKSLIGNGVYKTLDISSENSSDGTASYYPSGVVVDQLQSRGANYGVYLEGGSHVTKPDVAIGQFSYTGYDATKTNTPLLTATPVYVGQTQSLLSVDSIIARGIGTAVVSMGSNTSCSTASIGSITADFSTSPATSTVSSLSACTDANMSNKVAVGALSVNTHSDGSTVGYGPTTGVLLLPVFTQINK